jgi:Putative auto-transporter adhesin, head GIN domain
MLFRLIAALFALAALAPAHAAERSFLVGSFEDLIVEGDIQVTLETGMAPSAKATGDKDRLSALKVVRQGQVLRIRMQGLAANRVGGEPIRIALTGRNIKKLILQGNGRIAASGLDATMVRLEIRGSGEIEVGKLKTERLVALLVGSGKLTMASGTARDTEFVIDGSPVISAATIETQKLRLQQNGPAKSHFMVSDSAEIINSGTGTITIDGKGTCFVRQAGGATINCKKLG